MEVLNFITVKAKAASSLATKLPMIALALLILLAIFTGIWVSAREHPDVYLAAPTTKELADAAAKTEVLKKTRIAMQKLKSTDRGNALLEEAMKTPEGREALAQALIENVTTQPAK